MTQASQLNDFRESCERGCFGERAGDMLQEKYRKKAIKQRERAQLIKNVPLQNKKMQIINNRLQI